MWAIVLQPVGLSGLILTTQGIINRIKERKEAYSLDPGTEINFIDLPSPSNGHSLSIAPDFAEVKSLNRQ